MKTFVRGGLSGGAARGAGTAGAARPAAAVPAPAAAGRKRPLLQQQPAQSLSFGGAAVGATAEADGGYEEEHAMPVDDGFGFPGEDVAVKEEPVEQDFSFAPPGGFKCLPACCKAWCCACTWASHNTMRVVQLLISNAR
jgi:hypothetical protein